MLHTTVGEILAGGVETAGERNGDIKIDMSRGREGGGRERAKKGRSTRGGASKKAESAGTMEEDRRKDGREVGCAREGECGKREKARNVWRFRSHAIQL